MTEKEETNDYGIENDKTKQLQHFYDWINKWKKCEIP